MKILTQQETTEFLIVLQKRFDQHMERHKDVSWDCIQKRLVSNHSKLQSLYLMEQTQGEPDVIAYDQIKDEYIFCDCATESPKGRRSACYDHDALATRKQHKPADSAMHMATMMNIELLNEQQYRNLQTIGNYDLKTSSWILTPPEIRKLGGALFCDYRYGTVFVYHNGADSYYGARGFRGILRV